MKEYVLGFLFCWNYNSVWLIKKTKPEYQLDKLNGVGGKVDNTDESILFAMNREFREEGKLNIVDWKHFCTFSDNLNYKVHCYKSYSDEEPVSLTDEILVRVSVDDLPKNVMYNLHWLIPMAKDASNGIVYNVIEETVKNWSN